ncbi:AAA family ATPase [Candidatus Poriferisodalis sp.]|uniref:AAA family ATPase n=1 Tax=Candidatus Poriferisodalis sp. TaxID=3101277 RepID=UPI003B022F62
MRNHTAPHTHAADAEVFRQTFERITANVERIICGKSDAVGLSLMCLLCDGHLLIEDVPGVGKTSLAKSLAASIDVPFGRIQFTPDVLPSDVIGVSVWDERERAFDFRPGALFSSIVLVDEINRASPKTQAALLEAMQERQVTTDRTTRLLGEPFMVVATQNPIEHEGTYPLPESQLDRFLMRVSIGYPDADAAVAVLELHSGTADITLAPVATAQEILAMTRTVTEVHVAPALRRYIVAVADASRRRGTISLGISPRATLDLQRVAQAHALAAGRNYVVPDDVKAVSEPVLGHRIRLSPDAQIQGLTPAAALRDVFDTVAMPTSAG